MNDPDETVLPSPEDSNSPVRNSVPSGELQQIGRYRVERILGQGAFGLVYLAHDDQLKRAVAIKVPRPERLSRPQDADAYLAEARVVASLDHPNIVPIFDVGTTPDGLCYVVSKVIEGSDLAKKMQQGQLSHTQAATLTVTVAEALHYAHHRGLVHRDIKPANILLDTSDKPYVADFGLALKEEDFGKGAKFAGTPAYMSPEQARGEGHRVDGRSDIFSLGVVFYEMLTGRRPFKADSQQELLEQITTVEVRPPRQVDDSIPKELDRICLKALSKRASERYSAATDLADDLRHFLARYVVPASTDVGSVPPVLQPPSTLKAAETTPPIATPGSDSQPIKIVPKGLRSFDAHDADFFLELLPGARDRHGLPDSIRFWKIRIEEPDAEKTFSVGLICGPSGCGKSSLVKAGLLPHLAKSVLAVYLEATGEETETRLLNGLRKQCPALSDKLSLIETLAALRRGQGIPAGKKVLIVLDQFEQWLHAKKEEQNTELVQALRQCDGNRVQCIVMVRDDFWMAVIRFMRELEIRLLEGQNSAAADLFDMDHARKVLTAFGRAFGKIPESPDGKSPEQKEFLNQAVSGLAQGGKVISVRLALFAEMMKGKAWTPGSLKEVGGTEGVGVTFLEETFGAGTAPPEHRYHQKAARGVLKTLLPESGTDIKGHMRSYAELLEASDYGGRPKDFDDLIRILDSEIRLITPIDPEGVETDNDSVPRAEVGQKYYQLTHDYLVPSLREWLTRKQRETRTGRAELKLEERAAIWNTKRENKQLPSVGEWLSIRLLTDTKRWTAAQRIMMRTAARVQGVLWGGMLLAVLTVGTGIQQWGAAERWKSLREQTQTAAEAMQNNLGPSVPFNLEKLQTLPAQLVLPELQSRFSSTTNARHKLSLAFALAGYGQMDAKYLAARIDDIAGVDTHNYVMAMRVDAASALTALKTEALKCTAKPMWRRKAKLAIAALSLGDTEPALDVCTFENRPDPEQRTLFIDEFARWDVDLKAVLDAVKNSDSPGLRSGICLAVGQVPVKKISDAEKGSWKSVASQWFVEKGDTSTHSAAAWLLRGWKLPVPEIPEPHKITPQRDWFVVKTNGATMLRIRPAPVAVSKIPGEFWIADREVTRGQFEAFFNDATYAAAERPADWTADWTGVDNPTADHPAEQVSWYDAVLYCNWLSLREGRTVCYERTGTKEKSKNEEFDAWRVVPGATGYRLLREAEWEHACRAGTTTEFSSGDDEGLLVGYCQMHPSKFAAVCGVKLPNAWGLHDVHGNVSEWCEDQAYGGFIRVHRGGSWGGGAGNCQSALRYTGVPSYRMGDYGFRLALSSPSGVPPDAVKKNK